MQVADDGPGIPPALRESLFQRFTRGDASRNRATGSTGLGLAIVHAVVTAHGGTITVDRPDPGDHVHGHPAAPPPAAVPEHRTARPSPSAPVSREPGRVRRPWISRGVAMADLSNAFSGFSTDDVPAAKAFYADALGLDVTEENGMLFLHFAGGTTCWSTRRVRPTRPRPTRC